MYTQILVILCTPRARAYGGLCSAQLSLPCLLDAQFRPSVPSSPCLSKPWNLPLPGLSVYLSVCLSVCLSVLASVPPLISVNLVSLTQPVMNECAVASYILYVYILYTCIYIVYYYMLSTYAWQTVRKFLRLRREGGPEATGVGGAMISRKSKTKINANK